MEKTKQSLILSISLALVFIITIGLSYAYFSARLIGVERASTLTLDAGKMEIDYSENSNIIELYGIYPKEEAWATKTITLTGTNTTIDLDMHYKIGFEIEENTFSEGSLSYTIKNTLNESGTPLEDIESTIVKTSGNQYIGYGTFGRVEDKVHSYEIKIYFKNNGSSQNENQKARFKGKIIVEKVLDDELITVTFNPEGGELNTTTKKVLATGTYGTLPIPTKEGYEFLGWNGKNMFNEKSILMAISGAKYVDNFYIFTSVNAYRKYGNGKSIPIYDFKENTRYTISIYGYTKDHGWNYNFWINYNYLVGESNFSRFALDSYGKFNYTSDVNRTLSKITIAYNSSTTNYVKHVQFEEGAAATEWEPYYITNNLNIVQNKDHTLKAIWKEL